MVTAAPMFGTDEILWYDNGKWGQCGYAIANPNGKTWTNNSMLEDDRGVWAVAVPVRVRYEGDAQTGMPVFGHVFAEESAAANLTANVAPGRAVAPGRTVSPGCTMDAVENP